MPDILDDYRQWAAEQPQHVSTHSDRCHLWHDRCMIHRLAAALEAARSAGKESWIPVSERLPEGDVRVLVLVNGAADIACLNWHYGWMYEDYGSLEPTHWMPLPEPPEVK